MFRTTRQHALWWKNRKVDWQSSYLFGVLHHPHRDLILKKLEKMQWRSLCDVGCGAGAMLYRIQTQWPGCEIGGTDINKDALQVAAKYLRPRFLMRGVAHDVMLSDRGVDLILTDALLIYTGPLHIRKTLREFARIARNHVLFCELYTPSRFERIKASTRTGYNLHNYPMLLEELNFYNIEVQKIPAEAWPGTPWEQWGHIITATPPRS